MMTQYWRASASPTGAWLLSDEEMAALHDASEAERRLYRSCSETYARQGSSSSRRPSCASLSASSRCAWSMNTGWITSTPWTICGRASACAPTRRHDPVDRVQARGLRDVRGHDRRRSRKRPSAACLPRPRRRRMRTSSAQRVAKVTGDTVPAATRPSSASLSSRRSRLAANDPCPCGSGKKYKKCCRDKDLAAERGQNAN